MEIVRDNTGTPHDQGTPATLAHQQMVQATVRECQHPTTPEQFLIEKLRGRLQIQRAWFESINEIAQHRSQLAGEQTDKEALGYIHNYIDALLRLP